MSFEDFQRFKFVVGEAQRTYFLGSSGGTMVPLMAGDKNVIADKGTKEGAAVR